jgi:hypothetical protein
MSAAWNKLLNFSMHKNFSNLNKDIGTHILYIYIIWNSDIFAS